LHFSINALFSSSTLYSICVILCRCKVMENMYILCNYIPVINKKNSSLVRPPTRELLTQKLN
jgi:hypothetical protein